ncbi:SEC14-like protein 2 isoform X1 [Artemia franciscana]
MITERIQYILGYSKKEFTQRNESESDVVKKFKELVAGLDLPRNDDRYLLRWLRARDFDLLKAEKMLRNHLEWRKKYQVADLTDDWKPIEVLQKCYPVGIIGEDKSGSPVWLIRHGKLDIRGILQAVTIEEFVRYTVWMLEKSARIMERQSMKLGIDVSKQTIIFDLEHWSFQDLVFKPGMDVAMELIKIFEANYPEAMGYTFVINTPKFFQMAYSLLKPILSETTLSKIKIHGYDKSIWTSDILGVVPAEVLPKALGGRAVDPDGNEWCESLVPGGGPIPEYYKTGSESFGDEEEYKFDDDVMSTFL